MLQVLQHILDVTYHTTFDVVGDQIICVPPSHNQMLDLAVDGIPHCQGFLALNNIQKRVFQLTAVREEN